MRKAARKDINHNSITDIISELRDKHGKKINFVDTHQIKNFCDFVLTLGGIKDDITNALSSGLTVLVEVKASEKHELTDGEKKYVDRCYGNYIVVWDFESLLYGLKWLRMNEYQDEIEDIENAYYNYILKKQSPNQHCYNEMRKIKEGISELPSYYD